MSLGILVSDRAKKEGSCLCSLSIRRIGQHLGAMVIKVSLYLQMSNVSMFMSVEKPIVTLFKRLSNDFNGALSKSEHRVRWSAVMFKNLFGGPEEMSRDEKL